MVFGTWVHSTREVDFEYFVKINRNQIVFLFITPIDLEYQTALVSIASDGAGVGSDGYN